MVFSFFFGIFPGSKKFHYVLTGVERTKKKTKQTTKRRVCRQIRACNFFYACSNNNTYRGALDTRMNPGAFGRASSILIRYVWTRKFSNPQQKICGFKNIPIGVDRGLEV